MEIPKTTPPKQSHECEQNNEPHRISIIDNNAIDILAIITCTF